MTSKIICPKYNKGNCPKDGFVPVLQRYKCKECNCGTLFRTDIQKLLF